MNLIKLSYVWFIWIKGHRVLFNLRCGLEWRWKREAEAESRLPDPGAIIPLLETQRGCARASLWFTWAFWSMMSSIMAPDILLGGRLLCFTYTRLNLHECSSSYMDSSSNIDFWFILLAIKKSCTFKWKSEAVSDIFRKQPDDVTSKSCKRSWKDWFKLSWKVSSGKLYKRAPEGDIWEDEITSEQESATKKAIQRRKSKADYG